MSVFKTSNGLSTSEKISVSMIVLIGVLGLVLWTIQWLPFDAYLVFVFFYFNYLLTLQKPKPKYSTLQEKMVFEAHPSHGFETWNTLAYILCFVLSGIFLDKNDHFDGGMPSIVFLLLVLCISLWVRWFVRKNYRQQYQAISIDNEKISHLYFDHRIDMAKKSIREVRCKVEGFGDQGVVEIDFEEGSTIKTHQVDLKAWLPPLSLKSELLALNPSNIENGGHAT